MNWLSAPRAGYLKLPRGASLICMEGEEQLEERDASELVPFWIRLGLALPEPTAFEAR